MEAGSSTMVAAAKLPVLNPREFKLWKIRIEQYFLMTDYALWEVIVNGDSPPPKRTVDGVEQTYPPTTAEEKLARKNELKARGTLLMTLPNEHQLKFNTYKCAKNLMEAIDKRFRSNKESKKTQKTLLKQQYKNFNRSSSEGLNQTYDRLQKLIKWKTHTLIWRNKPDLDTLSMDDLYNNLKIYETKVKGSSSSNRNSQNVAFVSSNNSGSSNQAYGYNSANTDSMSDAIDADDLEEMDLKWQIAMLTMRARRFLNKTGRKINANGSEAIGFNKSKVECYNCHKKGDFIRECGALRENRNREPVRRNVTVETTKTKSLVAQDRLGYDWKARLDVYKKNEVVFEEDIKILKLDIKLRDNALTELRNKFEKAKKERDDLKLTLEKFGNSSKNLSKLLEIQVSDKFKTGVGFDSQVVDSHMFDSQENNRYKTSEGCHVVPPPYTGNFIPPKYDLVFANEGEYVFSESVTSIPDVATSEAKTSVSKPKSVSEPLIEDWISDSEDENETEFSFKHLIKDCDLYEKKIVEKTVWNNTRRANHQNSQRMTHPHLKGNFVPKAVLMISGIKTLNTAGQNFSKVAVSVNTARPINTTYPRPTVNSARTASNVFNRADAHVRRPFNKSTTNKNNNLKEKVNTVKGNVTTVGPKAVVSNNKGNEANVVKASACWVWRPRQKGNPQLELLEKGVIDSGFSRHMTGNKSHLSDYEEINGGFVAFGGNPKGGRITGKGKISTGIENLIDLKVKVIRCDNEIEFKNKVMNQFCEMKGRKPVLSFIRPFGCPVTILNTSDHLGKFDGKADEGFFVGYYTNCKAYSVFNSRTRIVEENLHVKFSKETPNIIRNGPNWLFDIDVITISMNYKPFVTRNQTNGNAGTKENIDAGQDGKKIVPDQKYILLPLLTSDPLLSKSLKDSPDAGFKPSGEEEKIDSEHLKNEDSEVPNTEEPRINQEQDANVNSTNNIKTVSLSVNAVDIENNEVDENIVYGCIDDPNMPNLEEIVYYDDDE
ncbi:putative ribonuclease H-like domain-containing protein [Tanacetum coccineum]